MEWGLRALANRSPRTEQPYRGNPKVVKEFTVVIATDVDLSPLVWCVLDPVRILAVIPSMAAICNDGALRELLLVDSARSQAHAIALNAIAWFDSHGRS